MCIYAKFLLLVFNLYFLASSNLIAGSVLIDDFEVDQVGILTDQYAAYDTLFDNRLFGATRTLWGGGASVNGNCETTRMSTSVSDGSMRITNGSDCYGAGNVTWGYGQQDLNRDFSNHQGIQIDVSEIIGVAWTRISISSGSAATQRLDVFLDSLGNNRIPFSSFPGSINLEDVDSITISTFIGQGEFVAFDSVIIFVPESSTVLLGLFYGCFFLHRIK